MRVEITYPAENKRKTQRRDIIRIAKWPFLFAAYICPILNLATGGSAWSVIVLWSLWTAWSLVFSPDLVEYNVISQLIKLISNSAILLILIGLLLSPGWAHEVVPIVCFSGMIVCACFLFLDLDRQRKNMLPMLLLCAVSLVCAAAGLFIWRDESSWALVVMGAISAALLIACAMVLGGEFVRDLKKYFRS